MDVDNGGGSIKKSLYLTLHFTVKLKLLWEEKFV